jgi:hypothetical protein
LSGLSFDKVVDLGEVVVGDESGGTYGHALDDSDGGGGDGGDGVDGDALCIGQLGWGDISSVLYHQVVMGLPEERH